MINLSSRFLFLPSKWTYFDDYPSNRIETYAVTEYDYSALTEQILSLSEYADVPDTDTQDHTEKIKRLSKLVRGQLRSKHFCHKLDSFVTDWMAQLEKIPKLRVHLKWMLLFQEIQKNYHNLVKTVFWNTLNSKIDGIIQMLMASHNP